MGVRLSTARGRLARRERLDLEGVQIVPGRAEAQGVIDEPVAFGQREPFKAVGNDTHGRVSPPARRPGREVSGMAERFVRDTDRGTGPERRRQKVGPAAQDGSVGHDCRRPKITASMMSV
jgi:hypothetical protein